MQFLKDRGEPIPQEDLIDVAREIKEKHGYCARNLVKELDKFDTKKKGDNGEILPSKKFI